MRRVPLGLKDNNVRQQSLFSDQRRLAIEGDDDSRPFRKQLLKWVGNKQRFAEEILACFPKHYGTYFEPFLGSGAVLGTLAPKRAVASDVCEPLMGIWKLLHDDPKGMAEGYRERWAEFSKDRAGTYNRVKARFNETRDPADLFFLSRTCYAGIIRFRKDGYMSTPIGPHKPVPPESVEDRIKTWHERTKGAEFTCGDFEATINRAKKGDLVYCDPPYADTQAILYGAQKFTLKRLYDAIARAKGRGVFVVLSIDGHKKSGKKNVDVGMPEGLFETEGLVNCGRSMLRRLQMEGQTLEAEVVADRLLLTWST
jgi:DNA adenine methylase